jgi:hypothetical protein
MLHSLAGHIRTDIRGGDPACGMRRFRPGGDGACAAYGSAGSLSRWPNGRLAATVPTKIREPILQFALSELEQA